jgi:hypothetical protein
VWACRPLASVSTFPAGVSTAGGGVSTSGRREEAMMGPATANRLGVPTIPARVSTPAAGVSTSAALSCPSRRASRPLALES